MDKNEQLIEKNAALNTKKRKREKTSSDLSFHIIMKHIGPAEMFRTELKIKDSEIDKLQKEIDELNASK